jgi:phosphatidylinositol glycan class C protein
MRGPSANREQGTTQDVASSDAWQRVLWKAQPFPDNYIPPSFLSSLRRNGRALIYHSVLRKPLNGRCFPANVLPYTYSQLFVSTCSVTQHVSCIFIFLAVFLRLQDSSLDPRVLVWISIACFVIGYAVWDLSRSAEVARLDRRQQRS